MPVAICFDDSHDLPVVAYSFSNLSNVVRDCTKVDYGLGRPPNTHLSLLTMDNKLITPK
jgi:hypothetical protein